MRRRNGSGPVLPSSGGVGSSLPTKTPTTTWLALIIFSSCTSFYLGVWTAWSIQPSSSDADLCIKAANGDDNGELGRKVGDIFQTRLDSGETMNCAFLSLDIRIISYNNIYSALSGKKCPEQKCSCSDAENAVPQQQSSRSGQRFNKSLNHFLSGAVAVNRKNLFDTFDFGVPISDNAESQSSLILYDSRRSLPRGHSDAAISNGEIPEMDAQDATANCDAMNVLFVKTPPGLRQCVALVGGQYQGYHVQKWMRVAGEGAQGKVMTSEPLHQVSIMVSSKGYDELTMPKEWHLKLHREIMLTYLDHLEEMQKQLKETLQKIAIDNTVIVLTVNKGQSELLMNWVCSSRSRGFDLKNALVFPTDQFSKDIAEGLGLATFYHEEVRLTRRNNLLSNLTVF